MVFEGDFVGGQHQRRHQGQDRHGRQGLPVPGGRRRRHRWSAAATSAVALKDGKGAQALLTFLASPDAAEIWAQRGRLPLAEQGRGPGRVPGRRHRATIAKALIAAGDDFRFDMSDQAPAAFGGTQGEGEWKDLQDFLKNPKDVAGTQAQAGGRRRQGVRELTAPTWSRRTRPRTAAAPPLARRRARARACTGTRRWVAALFLLPALVLLGALVVYPIGYSVCRSLFDAAGDGFVGLRQLRRRSSPTTPSLTAIKQQRDLGGRRARRGHRARPDLRGAHRTGALGHRVQAGRLHADGDLDARRRHHLPAGLRAGPGPGRRQRDRGSACTTPSPTRRPTRGPARGREASDLSRSGGGSFTTGQPVQRRARRRCCRWSASRRTSCPAARRTRRPPRRAARRGHRHRLAGLQPGRRRHAGADRPGREGAAGRQGRGGQGRQGGRLGDRRRRRHLHAARPTADGAQLRLPARELRRRRTTGVDWLGPTLVTPAIIGAYIWMWAGFAMVLIAAGLAGVPRELLEAARVDGANEWQVFRRITVPLLAPVLVGGPRHADDQRAEDLRPGLHHRAAAQSRTTPTCWRSSCTWSSFGGGDNQGLGSAIGVLLLLLVLPGDVLQHPAVPKGASAMTTRPRPRARAGRPAGAGTPGAPSPRGSPAGPAAAWCGSSCILVALFWLMPTVGLLLSSLRDPTDIAAERLVEGLHRARAADLRQLPHAAGRTTRSPTRC